MKITTWNCCCEFNREKAEMLKNEFDSDILVIQECKHRDLLMISDLWKYSCWYGDYKDSKLGIGVFSSEYSIAVSSINNNELRYFVPFDLVNAKEEISLFAIWTKGKFVDDIYIGQILKAQENDVYKNRMKQSVVIGDFNVDKNYSNIETRFTKMIERFSKIGLESSYHKFSNTTFGNENIKTWKKYGHIDYCFLPSTCNVSGVRFGDPEKWYYKEQTIAADHRDHLPMQIEFVFG